MLICLIKSRSVRLKNVFRWLTSELKGVLSVPSAVRSVLTGLTGSALFVLEILWLCLIKYQTRTSPGYIDISVLLGNRPLEQFIRHYIRGLSGVFSIRHWSGLIDDVTTPLLACVFIHEAGVFNKNFLSSLFLLFLSI